MSDTGPTHIVTHKDTHTAAAVSVGPRIAKLIDTEQPLSDGDKDFLAMRLGRTPPLPRANHGLPDFIDRDDITVEVIPRGAPYGEETGPLGPGGTVLDTYDE